MKGLISGLAILLSGASMFWYSHQIEIRERCVPVIFVHGFGGKGNDWLRKNYHTAFPENSQFQYFGDVKVSQGEVLFDQQFEAELPNVLHPYFTLTLRNQAFDAIPDLGDDVGACVEKVVEVFRCQRVCLVGFSLGGIVCRDYLVRNPNRAPVKQLITVSSPHFGSAFAYLSDVAKAVRLQPEPSLLGMVAEKSIDQLNQVCMQHNLDIHAQSLAMLQPPKAGNYLDWLNQKTHPERVEYFSIITEKSVPHYSLNDAVKDSDKLAAGQLLDSSIFAAAADLVRMGIDMVAKNEIRFGDGFVGADSQDMAKIPALRNEGVVHQRVEVPSTHFDDVLQKQLVSFILQKY